MGRTSWAVFLAAALAAVIAGCGGGVEQAKPRREVPGISSSVSPVQAPREQATAEEIDYQGWRALRLTNGMVTLVVVPEAGGRVLEYKLGGHPYLWLNPAELGKSYPPAELTKNRAGHDFGGYSAWPASADSWQGPPEPSWANLEAGKWTGKITVRQGRTAEVELTSPEDRTTGLQVTRVVKLYGGSSQVRITERFTNKSDQTVTWAIRQATRLTAAQESDGKVNDKARLYLPLNPDSKFSGGFRSLVPAGAGQFKTLADHLLQMTCQGRDGGAVADPRADWIAGVDEAHDYTFVQRFTVSQAGDYPEAHAALLLATLAAKPYAEVSVYTPVKTLQPGDSLEASVDWFAAKVGGPVVDCGPSAAVREPLKLARKADKLRLTGRFGVFAPGNLAFILQDAAGQAIGQPATLKVSPGEEVKLDQVIAEEAKAKTLVVELQNDAGTPLGQIGSLPLGATVAQASAPK